MESWGVGIEVTHSSNADAFMQALRCFIARCVSIRALWPGNDTNFVGAEWNFGPE